MKGPGALCHKKELLLTDLCPTARQIPCFEKLKSISFPPRLPTATQSTRKMSGHGALALAVAPISPCSPQHQLHALRSRGTIYHHALP